MKRRLFLQGAVAAGAGAAAAQSRPAPTPAPATAAGPVLRLGPERLAVADSPHQRELKQALFERLNADRAAHGVAPLAWEPRAARVADRFCLDAALGASFGHWDPEGRAPYVRWALAGGVDYHAENVGAYAISGGKLLAPLLELALESHAAMMAERPPHDGHRRTILDPTLTHVGIGVGAAGGQVRMAQEFTRVGFDWVEVPSGPLRAGAQARFAARPLAGREIGLVEVRFEPPPRPLHPGDGRHGAAYGYPPIARSLYPRTAVGVRYVDGSTGDFRVNADGSFETTFALDRGPGLYLVLCYLRDGPGEMQAFTAAGIVAHPW
ncbi:MAG: CAP domain-containing protein [Vicinamibacteria bacterium]|nr:CAP domain-containing protein [Vicinamibacteria bacterium]